jgi:hypothetical protein
MRGSIRKRGRNSWEFRFEEGPRVEGKRRTRHVTFRGTGQEAQKELTRPLADADIGKLPDAARTTVAERIGAWLAGAHNVAPKTRERYAELAANQVLPHLGAVSVNKLKNDAIRAWHALGLQWGDLNLDAGTLRVERSVEETKAGLPLKPPKTRRSKRNLTLPP